MKSQRRPSNRGEIAPFYVMEVMRAAEEREQGGGEVLHLEVGQPSTPAPAGVIAAAHRALDEDVLGYTTAAGTPELRARVARHYDEWYGVDVDAGRLMFTVGASGAFVAAFLAAFDVGDRVVVPSPGYPCYRNALEALGCEVVDLATTMATRFQPTVELLDEIVAEGGPIAGLVLSSPSNPTGTMLDDQRMAEITTWCRANGVWFVSDEIYHGLSYGEPAPTALRFDPDAIVINSFSKYFSMTGWRLGWLVMPDALRDALTRIGQNVTISAPTLSQLGAVAAFDCHDECQANVDRYTTNRRIVLDGLRDAGFADLAPADGAFYVWAGIDHLIGAGRTTDSQALCATWLDELGVATTPGVDFDPTRGHRSVRFSFAGSTEDCAEAMRRLRDWATPEGEGA
ncbi:MAG: aminotransferase class I/II-fold pyridoxal phosphate-dependent enzyme [Actinomycetota bacterium]